MLLRTLEHARRIREAAAATRGGDVVVVGGGLIGVEVASSLATLGLRPTIVELTGALWGGALGSLLDAWARERLADAGVEVLLGASASAITDDAVVVGDRSLPAAFVVSGIGVRPRDELAAAAGLATSRGIDVGADQRTSDPSVWAAGDATRLDGRATEHWHGAREAGERAALSMLGLEIQPPRAPWTFTEVAGIGVDVFGEAERDDAEEWIGDSVIARTRGSALTQLVVIGSAVPAESARRMVEERVSRATIEASIAASEV
jgi:3-phenylpropionate/trans-cinnamate dioxygenase ferredoxin reductase subunit